MSDKMLPFHCGLKTGRQALVLWMLIRGSVRRHKFSRHCLRLRFAHADHKQTHLPVKEYPIAVPTLQSLGGAYGVVCEIIPPHSSDGMNYETYAVALSIPSLLSCCPSLMDLHDSLVQFNLYASSLHL